MRPLVLAAVLVASAAHARQPNKPFVPKPKTDADQKLDTSSTLKDLRIGKAICGPKLAAEDLKGKIVVVEFWGVNCPLCLAALPETAALHADLSDFGLVVIGAHCQKATAERVREVAVARGANFSITEETAIVGDEIPELPYAVVFDHTGACVYRGSPRDAEVKVRAALAALDGSDCILIARTNADPATQLDEGIERMRMAHELGAEMTTVVKLTKIDDARRVARGVPGWKMYPDVATWNGVPEITAEECYALGFNFLTTHYTLKAAMDGMLEHGKRNFAEQGVSYTCMKEDATGIMGMSATPLFDPQSYMELQARFGGQRKEYTIVGNKVEEFPAGFVRTPIDDRL